MAILIAPAIVEKIQADDHGNVAEKEVYECFANNSAGYCYEQHPEHQIPGKESLWFVACTNHGRRLKVMFVLEDKDVHVKSAYPASDTVTRIFERFAGPVEQVEW